MPAVEIKQQDGTSFFLSAGDRYEVRRDPGGDVWNTRYVFVALTNHTLIVYQGRTDLYTTTKRILQDLFDIGDLRKVGTEWNTEKWKSDVVQETTGKTL